MHPANFQFKLPFLALLLAASVANGDGKLFRPRSYQGSIEEKAQEAIIIFNVSDGPGGSFEDLILKIDVKGQTDKFAWVIPFPKEPKVEKEDAKLFGELFNYVDSRTVRYELPSKDLPKKDGDDKPAHPVEVLSRRTVGSYDVAIVREKEAGALNQWLAKEEFQTLPDDADDVIGFYRKKGYVFACIKVKDANLNGNGSAVLHPLRFSFQTGDSQGIYFPMKMSGLQDEPFDVNLYVFSRYWIDHDHSQRGYVHRGFDLFYRDLDSRQCKPNAGKSWSAPEEDPYLRSKASLVPTVKMLFQKLHPGERYYLTNIKAQQLKPAEVRHWNDDLWLFPSETNVEKPDQVDNLIRIGLTGVGVVTVVSLGICIFRWRRKRPGPVGPP